jgi:hypothetical protein
MLYKISISVLRIFYMEFDSYMNKTYYFLHYILCSGHTTCQGQTLYTTFPRIPFKLTPC